MPDRAENLVKWCGLRHKGRNPGLQGAEEYVVLLLRRQDDDAEVRVAIPELTSKPEAVAAWQRDVDGHDVRLRSGDHARHLRRGLALGHNLNVRMLRDKLAQAVADERLPVGYGEMNWHSFPPKGRMPTL